MKNVKTELEKLLTLIFDKAGYWTLGSNVYRRGIDRDNREVTKTQKERFSSKNRGEKRFYRKSGTQIKY